MYSAAPSWVNGDGRMNLASNTALVASTMPSRVAAIQRTTELNAALDRGDDLCCVRTSGG